MSDQQQIDLDDPIYQAFIRVITSGWMPNQRDRDAEQTVIEAIQERERLLKEHATMLPIVQAMAHYDITPDESVIHPVCHFCTPYPGSSAANEPGFVHQPDCPQVAAVKFLEEHQP